MIMYDWAYAASILAFIFALFAQFKVKSTFNKFSKTANAKGMTGKDAAKLLLERAGIHNVKIELVKGKLSDHYDPRSQTLRLSESVHDNSSLAAVGVAAHEAGHAIQHEHGYAPLGLRSAIVPICSFGSRLAWPAVVIGLLVTQFSNDVGLILINAGIVMLALMVVFSLITLPVEFNASARAVDLLESEGILAQSEIPAAKKVLSAAAMTYVASAAVAITQLIRVILIRNSRR
jgi:hypothetical protein